MADTEHKRAKSDQPKLITGFLAGMLYFFFVVGISAALAVFGWQSAKDVLGLMKPDKEATIVVSDNFEISSLSKTLKEKGIIEYPWLFSLYCKVSKAGEKIKPGEYTINALLDYRAIIYNMRGTASVLQEVRIPIPEGFTLKQIIQVLVENGVADEDELWETAQYHKYEYSFLGALPFESNRLEGYLYPDTYDFYIGENPISVFNKMLSNFNRKFTIEYRERVKEMDMSVAEIITIASMIEKEAANDEERPIVASVIYNRLSSSKFKYLQIDATLQYFLSEPKPIPSSEDLQIDNPYNTYLYEGLPPGPIANPGLESVRAALYPEETGYYYYALTSDYTHKFSKTSEEHEKVKNANKEFYDSLR